MTSIPSEILELIERFERNIHSCRSLAYNEAQLRREFLNSFFKALGWDVYNEQGYAEAYKEVIQEDQKISTTRTLPRFIKKTENDMDRS